MLTEQSCIEQLTMHLNTDNFEMFCHVYNESENLFTLSSHHDKIIMNCLSTIVLPLGKKTYNPIKRYVHFLVEKNPTAQLVYLMIAQKEDVSKYLNHFNSLDHILFLHASCRGNNPINLSQLNVQEDVLIKLIFRLPFPKGEKWFKQYIPRNKELFCQTILCMFLESVFKNNSSNKRDYYKFITFTFTAGLNEELTKTIIEEQLSAIKIRNKVVFNSAVSNQNTVVTHSSTTTYGPPNYYTYNRRDYQGDRFCTPLEAQSCLIVSPNLEMAEKIYSRIKLSEILVEKKLQNKINKI